MHIPDGFLSPEVAAACAVPAAAAVGIGLHRANTTLDERRVPLLGVTAAFVFAAQMLNFPVAGGTSGHFLGAALAAILLGPWLACLTLAVVLGVQALLFADGGITALGANVFNMGVAGALLVGGLMRAANAVAPKRLVTISAVGAWLAVMTGAALTAVELAASGTVPLGTVLPAMLGTHALIGVGEAAITLAAVSAVLATRPDLIDQPAPVARPTIARRPFVVVALAVAIGVATAASPFASSQPDGLERVASDEGFAAAGKASSGPIADYAIPGLDDARLATGLAGFTGTLVVFGVGFALTRGRRRFA